jgi:hypothetical protein
VGVKRGRKKAENRPAWAIILKKAMVKIKGPHAKEAEKRILFFQVNIHSRCIVTVYPHGRHYLHVK